MITRGVLLVVWPVTLVLWVLRGRPDPVTVHGDRAARRRAREGVGRTGTDNPGRPIVGTPRGLRAASGPPAARADGLPADIVARAERYARFEADPQASTENNVWADIVAPLHKLAQKDPDGFARRLHDAVMPVGGWAVLGGAELLWEIYSEDRRRGAAYEALLDGAIDFLRQSGVPPMRVKGYFWDHWIAKGGANQTWLPMIPPPHRETARLTPLRPGETRRVAQLWEAPDANVMMVRATADGRVEEIVDGRTSDEDPTRALSVLATHDTLYDAYVSIGLRCQTPAPWFDPDLAPFFPLPRARI